MLNADGLLDIVFCNAMHNYRPDQAVSVYWGDPTGFNAHNRMDLPAFLAQADLDPVSIEKVNVPRIWSLVTCVKD